MAKKYEFQPDKPHSDWQSKLHLTPQQRRAIIKWCLYGVVLLIISLIQDVIMCRFRFWGATTELIPCAIFLIVVLEGSHRGSIFALSAATLYVFTGASHGVHCIVAITVFGVIVAIFRQAYLEKHFIAALLCVAAAMCAYEMVIYGVCLLFGQIRATQVLQFLITAGLSLIAAPILYPAFKSINAIGGDKWKE